MRGWMLGNESRSQAPTDHLGESIATLRVGGSDEEEKEGRELRLRVQNVEVVGDGRAEGQEPDRDRVPRVAPEVRHEKLVLGVRVLVILDLDSRSRGLGLFLAAQASVERARLGDGGAAGAGEVGQGVVSR